MARPPKEGIDYAGWDVSIFDSDEKIDALIDSQGIAGFTVYFYLCQKAYGTRGYYLSWGSSQAASVSRRLGKGCSAALVESVVEKCLQICLFDRELFALHGILTSQGIQRRYWAVKKDRSRNEPPTEYWLLGDETSKKTEGFIPNTQNENFTHPKPSFDPPIIHERKEKERKENIRSMRGAYQNVDITDEQYAELAKVIPGIDSYLDTFSEKLYFKKYRYQDHYKAILEWWERDKTTRKPVKKGAGSGSFDVSDFLAKAIKKGYGK